MTRFFAGLSLIMTSFQAAFGTIAKADTLTFLEQQIAALDERDLVVFDMDDVLIVAIDAILHLKVETVRSQLHALYLSHLPKQQQALLFSYIWKTARTTLVEPHTPSLIEAMQKKGIKVIVLTAAPVGSFGVIEDTAAFRIQELQEKGIHLNRAFPEVASIVLEELDNGKGAPEFRHGVMLSHRIPKGEVLAAFLKKLQWKPRRLIFIDDLFHNVESVENLLTKAGVKELQCWHYTGSDRHVKEVDHEVADLQVRTLVEKGIWLSDDEAAAQIATSKAIY